MSSNLGRGQLVRFSHPDMTFVPNFECIYIIYSPRGEALHHRPPTPVFCEVGRHVKNCHFRRYYFS